MQSLRIVVPVFDDWESFGILVRELDRVAGELQIRVDVSAINDGSTVLPARNQIDLDRLQHLHSLEIVHLRTNLGHQRAIAVGICFAVQDENCDAILVMDSDGEDPPLAVGQMIKAAGQEADFCVVARRGKRNERLTFQISYLLYKVLFKLLTGRQINFGNFCFLSRSYAHRLVTISDLWNNLPAAILRSRLPIKAVSVDRAQRYSGKSKMNLTSLVVHGFSGIAVYAETIFVRFLILALALFLLSALSIPFVLTLRIFFPQYATPGWATTVSFGVSMILVQTLSFTLSFVIMLLNNRVQRLFIPIVDFQYFVDHRELLLSR
jgi:polyisoprenyl-phosphate glycosyltransferase